MTSQGLRAIALKQYGIQNAYSSTLVLALVSKGPSMELSLAEEKKVEPGPWSKFSSLLWDASSFHIFLMIFVSQEINLP